MVTPDRPPEITPEITKLAKRGWMYVIYPWDIAAVILLLGGPTMGPAVGVARSMDALNRWAHENVPGAAWEPEEGLAQMIPWREGLFLRVNEWLVYQAVAVPILGYEPLNYSVSR